MELEAEFTDTSSPPKKSAPPSSAHSSHEANFEFKTYSSGLKWVFLDHSSLWRAGFSWSIFFLLNIGVPLVSHYLFSCSDCDLSHQRPFDAIIQLSLSVFAAISFVSLSSFARIYGLRKFLFLDKLCDQSERVRRGYAHQVNRSMKLLSAWVLPCFFADSVYKIWWFSSSGTQIPYLYNEHLSKIIVCILLMCSWLYRTSICFLVCILFRLTCHLQILRLEDYAKAFLVKSDVAAILIEHLRIRRNLRIISHRFRRFVLSTLFLVTISQFISLLVTMKPSSKINIFTAGELALCSITLVTGLFICLRSAARITHKAQAVASLASKWHACGTISSFDELDHQDQTPTAQITSIRASNPVTFDWDTDNEEEDGDDALDNTSMYANTISYQKRQALVKYFEHNKAGITVYGFLLDRTWLRIIFAIHLSLTLWILRKTIDIS